MSHRHIAGRWDALGHTFSLWSDDPRIAAHLANLYATLPAADGPTTDYGIELSGGGFVVHGGGGPSTPKTSLGRALAVLSSRLNRAVLALERAEPLLHASAAAREAGAVLLPAAMESGKSTLVAGLLRTGWSYLTDEAVLVDAPALTARGLLKPLSLDQGSWSLFPEARPNADGVLASVGRHQWQVPPGRLGAAVPCVEARLAAIVFPRHVNGAPTELQRLRRAEVLESLLHCAFRTSRSGEHFEQLAAVAEAVPGYRLTGGSLAESVAAVTTALEESIAIGT